MCQRGQAVVQELFETFGNQNLRGLMAWLPMLPGDDADTARTRSTLVQDPRVVKGWDAQRLVSEAFQRLLGLGCPAWDVYLLYPPGPRWDGTEPPQPVFWMHQLPEAVGAPSALRLEPRRLERELRGLLADAPPAG